MSLILQKAIAADQALITAITADVGPGGDSIMLHDANQIGKLLADGGSSYEIGQYENQLDHSVHAYFGHAESIVTGDLTSLDTFLHVLGIVPESGLPVGA